MSNTLNSIINNLDDLHSKNLKSIFIDIISQLNCPICQDVPTQPYLIPTCGHTFCYDCIKSWFPFNPSCPVCRSIIGENKPILNHMLKNLIDNIILNLKSHLLNSNLIIDLNNWEIERNKDYKIDKISDFPWIKNISANWGRAVVDNEDGVPRCSACHWELIDGHCENCGRTMVGWQNRLDGDEIIDDDDDDDEDEDDEDENLFRQQSTIQNALSSDYDDYDDYDNGLNDMPNRFVHNEAEDDDDDDDDDDNDDDDDEDDENGIVDEYESDDGFVVDDDEISRIDDSDIIEDENNSNDSESDDDIINNAKNSSINSKPIFTDSSDIIDLSDIGSDNDLIKTTKSIRNKRNSNGKKLNVVNIVSTDEENVTPDPININLSDDSEEEILKTFRSSKKQILPDEQDEDEDEDEDDEDENKNINILPPKSKKKHKHKHKHKNKHKKSKR